MITLPEMPIAGKEVAEELKTICMPSTKCFYLTEWLNKMYIFRTKYLIYKTELNN